MAGAATASAATRLMNEARMWKAPVYKTRTNGCTIDVAGDDAHQLVLHVALPDKMKVAGKEYDSPFKGRSVDVDVTLPKEYPFKQPECLFKMVPYHPNVSKSGQVCTEELKWAPSCSMINMANFIRGLFAEPNMGSPMNPDAHGECEKDFDAYAAKAKKDYKVAEPDEEG